LHSIVDLFVGMENDNFICGETCLDFRFKIAAIAYGQRSHPAAIVVLYVGTAEVVKRIFYGLDFNDR
jgi:hypothetical protein